MKTGIHLRASMLPNYGDCARRTAASQWKKEIQAAGYDLRTNTPNVGGCVGTAVHAAAAHMLDRKMATGSLPTLNDSQEVAVTSFRSDSSDGLEWDDKTRNPNMATQQIQRMVAAYRRDIAEEVTPVLVEAELEATVQDEAVLTGHIDLLTADGALRDTKCGKVPRPHYGQMGAYGMLLEADGHQCTAMIADWIPRESMKKPQPQPVSETYNMNASLWAAWSTIQQIIRDVTAWRHNKENPWAFPANPMSQMCSEKYCPAWGTGWCELGR